MPKIARVIDVIQDVEDTSELKARLRDLQTRRAGIRDDLAALPEPGALPDASRVAVEGFRASLLEAWKCTGLHEKRRALAQLVSSIQLTADQTAILKYRWAEPGTAYGVQSPFGPPKGSAARYRVGVMSEEVRRPRVRAAP